MTPTESSGPAGPRNTVMQKHRSTADNYSDCLFSICLPSRLCGFEVTSHHPRKHCPRELTEPHSGAAVMQQTLLISPRRERQLPFVVATPVLVSAISILLAALSTHAPADHKSRPSELLGAKSLLTDTGTLKTQTTSRGVRCAKRPWSERKSQSPQVPRSSPHSYKCAQLAGPASGGYSDDREMSKSQAKLSPRQDFQQNGVRGEAWTVPSFSSFLSPLESIFPESRRCLSREPGLCSGHPGVTPLPRRDPQPQHDPQPRRDPTPA